MPPRKLILLGDYSPDKPAHIAIPLALERACAEQNADLVWEWVHTGDLDPTLGSLPESDALWVVPGSPYANIEAVLAAIRQARESGHPFLGTCGGFQHALIEFARNVAGLPDADHTESNPDATLPLLTPLACALVETTGRIHFNDGSLFQRAYQASNAEEGYRCSYGLNSLYRSPLAQAGLHFTAFDDDGQLRGAELPGHPFFAGTLFQPERAALAGRPAPLINAFVRAISRC